MLSLPPPASTPHAKQSSLTCSGSAPHTEHSMLTCSGSAPELSPLVCGGVLEVTPLLAEASPARCPCSLCLALLQVCLSGVPVDQGAVKAGRGEAGVVGVPAAVAHNLPVVLQRLHSLAGDDVCSMGWKTGSEMPRQLQRGSLVRSSAC